MVLGEDVTEKSAYWSWHSRWVLLTAAAVGDLWDVQRGSTTTKTSMGCRIHSPRCLCVTSVKAHLCGLISLNVRCRTSFMIGDTPGVSSFYPLCKKRRTAAVCLAAWPSQCRELSRWQMYHAKMKLLRIFNRESQQPLRTCIITEHRIIEWLPYLLLLPSWSCQMFHGYIRLPWSVPRRPTLHSLHMYMWSRLLASHFSPLLSSCGSRLWAGEKGVLFTSCKSLSHLFYNLACHQILWSPVNSFASFLSRAFSSLCLREHRGG